MNYIAYDVSDNSPSLAERDIIWSVLLWGDKVQITSNMALPFLLYGDFPFYSEQQKFDSYELFKPMIETVTTWDEFDLAIKFILQQRKKKQKTGLEVKDLANREVWLRKTEKWFYTSLHDNLAKYNYEEIVPLTYRYPDQPPPDVVMTLPLPFAKINPESVVEMHLIKIVTSALSQQDNVFVFDERIFPFIENYALEKINSTDIKTGEKTSVFSEKIFNMPLCFILKENEIRSARNEMKPAFRKFHECLHNMDVAPENLGSAFNQLCSLLPEIERNIENSNFVQNVRNQSKDAQNVELHLAFTSNRGILTLINRLGMFNDEQVLQAYDLISEEANVDRLRPFMFIKHLSSETNE